MSDTNNMKMSLDIKKPSQFFWLCKIRDVDISRCCKKCFCGESEGQMYHGTAHGQTPRFIELEVKPAEKYVAYYLCGLSRGFVYENNTHVAFLHAPGELLQVDTAQIELKITNARRIDFEGYKPDPPGEYTEEQRKCRNWIFANYVRDGMIKRVEGAASKSSDTARDDLTRAMSYAVQSRTLIDALSVSLAEPQRTVLQEILDMILLGDWEGLARIEEEGPFNNIIGQISELWHLLKAMIDIAEFCESETAAD